MVTPEEERTANAHASIARIIGVPVSAVVDRSAAVDVLGQSLTVGVTCGACGADLGDQGKPGDGLALFRAHVPECPRGGQR